MNVQAILIGGSAGSIDILRSLIAALPPLELPVMAVVHLPPRAPGRLHEVLSAPGWVVKQAEDKEPLESRTVYIAPPGYHLLVETDRSFALSMDDPVLFSRPSIDVLFESACDAFDGRLLAILLSGASGDGANGMRTIHRAGGVTIVQSPETAEADLMPKTALALIAPSHVLSPAEIAELIRTLPRLMLPGAR